MGKLICDSTASSPVIIPWLDPSSFDNHLKNPIFNQETTNPEIIKKNEDLKNEEKEQILWENVGGLEDQQKRNLLKLQKKGVLWKNPTEKGEEMVFKLSHGGEVESDGNCLFTSAKKAMGLECGARELRGRCVRRFFEDYDNESDIEKKGFIDGVIRGMYDPDLGKGWGVHVVQEVKVVVRKNERGDLEDRIQELVRIGMQRELAAESIYKERCIAVKDGASWTKYMTVSGSPDDEYDIINLQYTEEGLLTVDENIDGRAAAFGDDIAIECLATEFKREIFVVQAHGSDAMVDEDNCVFFLPHRPRSEICGPPVFLFMKGTGWCGAGADHYEPLIAQPSPVVSHEKVALVL